MRKRGDRAEDSIVPLKKMLFNLSENENKIEVKTSASQSGIGIRIRIMQGFHPVAATRSCE
jgi:hypothetical protein